MFDSGYINQMKLDQLNNKLTYLCEFILDRLHFKKTKRKILNK